MPKDDVDRIVSAWRRERPDTDVSPLEVLSRISRLARRLDLARRAAFSELQLEAWEFDVMSALRRAGGRYELSPSQLVAETLVTSGTMTNRIDRLVARGLVERHSFADDRRRVVVRLTDTGVGVVDSALDGLLAQERELLGELPQARRSALADDLRMLLTPFES